MTEPLQKKRGNISIGHVFQSIEAQRHSLKIFSEKWLTSLDRLEEMVRLLNERGLISPEEVQEYDDRDRVAFIGILKDRKVDSLQEWEALVGKLKSKVIIEIFSLVSSRSYSFREIDHFVREHLGGGSGG